MAIALPSFLNQANKARASTANTRNGDIDSLTGLSGTSVGAAASTPTQPHSSVELESTYIGTTPSTNTRQYVGSINRAQQAYLFEKRSLPTGSINQTQQAFDAENYALTYTGAGASRQTMGAEGVVSWSIGFADVIRPSNSLTPSPITPPSRSF